MFWINEKLITYINYYHQRCTVQSPQRKQANSTPSLEESHSNIIHIHCPRQAITYKIFKNVKTWINKTKVHKWTQKHSDHLDGNRLSYEGGRSLSSSFSMGADAAEGEDMFWDCLGDSFISMTLFWNEFVKESNI